MKPVGKAVFNEFLKEEQILKKIENNEKFDEKELKYLIDRYGIDDLEGVVSDFSPYMQDMETIVEIPCGKFYIISWVRSHEQGIRDNIFKQNLREVKLRIRKEWVYA